MITSGTHFITWATFFSQNQHEEGGFENVTGLKFDNRFRIQIRIRSPIQANEVPNDGHLYKTASLFVPNLAVVEKRLTICLPI